MVTLMSEIKNETVIINCDISEILYADWNLTVRSRNRLKMKWKTDLICRNLSWQRINRKQQLEEGW